MGIIIWNTYDTSNFLFPIEYAFITNTNRRISVRRLYLLT